MNYWWCVERPLLPEWILVLPAVAFLAYLVKFHGFTPKKLIKTFAMLWFAYTVVFANLVLLMLLGIVPVKMSVEPRVLVVNMFTMPAVAAALTFSNVFGVVEMLFNLVPSFLLSAGAVKGFTLELTSAAVTAVLLVVGSIVFVYCV